VQAIQDAGRPGVVRISSEADDAGVTVQIHDDGIGMSPNSLTGPSSLSSPPARWGRRRARLVTARNIVLAHSGRIELASTPDVGHHRDHLFPDTDMTDYASLFTGKTVHRRRRQRT
jgi:two-component system NtrC family sensor kinase